MAKKLKLQDLSEGLGLDFAKSNIKTEKGALDEVNRQLENMSSSKLQAFTDKLVSEGKLERIGGVTDKEMKAEKSRLVKQSKQFSRDILTEREQTFDSPVFGKVPTGKTEFVEGHRKTLDESISPKGAIKKQIADAQKDAVKKAIRDLIGTEKTARADEIKDSILENIATGDSNLLESLEVLQQAEKTGAKDLDLIPNEDSAVPKGQAFLEKLLAGRKTTEDTADSSSDITDLDIDDLASRSLS